ncbi:Ubiquitin thioesterase otubain-like [Zea mays]|uniref:Ubiquitin thioesterase otubain-like n=1 Tax=Zea mays TaxID=4577 RepID=A0A1D6ISX3_MAIZE|nr:Ubiquitin thioesterase otubain-like [Zea mays]AQK39172.1 Ubiquitin thioesterase otubain-like [Zea mays]
MVQQQRSPRRDRSPLLRRHGHRRLPNRLRTSRRRCGAGAGRGRGGAAREEAEAARRDRNSLICRRRFHGRSPVTRLFFMRLDVCLVDDEKPDEFEKENGWGSLFMSDPQVLSMHDPQNLPRYIGRQKCDPISTQEFFALRHDWLQLLDGKKTYLRGTADSNYADSNFVTPKPLTVAVLCQESLSYLVLRGARKPITQQKFKILNEHYVCFRPMRTDGSQFYRAFLFSYLENLGKMQGSQAEVTRLMECVARSKVNFCRLEWNKAYFSNPKAFFSSVVSEFEHLVNSVANGLNADELYKISVQENSSSRILCLLRLLTEVHIRTHEVDYNRELSQNRKEKIKALLHCKKSVRPFDADADLLEMKALSQALGIPLHLAAVDDNPLPDRTVQVKWIDFIPRPGPLGSIREYYLGPLGSIRQYYLPSATDKHPVLPAENFLLSGRMPLVTILRTVRATAILYRK